MDFTPLPEEPAWALPVADTRSPLSMVTLRRDLEAGASAETEPLGTLLDANIAADFPLLGVAFPPVSDPEVAEGGGEGRFGGDTLRLTLGISAASFLGFHSEGTLTFGLRTFDGLFAFPLDASWGMFSSRLQWVHVSAHYGDGIRSAPELTRNTDPYSREYVQWQVAADLSRYRLPVRVYGGGSVVTHAAPVVPAPAVQVGGEFRMPWTASPYVAADLKLAAEDKWKPHFSGQVGGVAQPGRTRFRLALSYVTGPEDTGKFHLEDERYIGVVFGFDTTGALWR